MRIPGKIISVNADEKSAVAQFENGLRCTFEYGGDDVSVGDYVELADAGEPTYEEIGETEFGVTGVELAAKDLN